MKKGKIDPKSVATAVMSFIASHGKGWVFTPANLKGLGSRAAVESALRRLKQSGTIRQLARGLYDYPRHDAQLGVLSPSIDAIADAVRIRDAVRLQPAGAYAANILDLSTQIPMKVVFLTDGAGRKIRIGKQEIIFKRTTPRNMATAGTISGTVIQALRWLGHRHVDDDVVETLGRRLDDKAKAQLMKDIGHAPIWIADIIRKLVCQGGGSS